MDKPMTGAIVFPCSQHSKGLHHSNALEDNQEPPVAPERKLIVAVKPT
jgi:hypothetical protein